MLHNFERRVAITMAHALRALPSKLRVFSEVGLIACVLGAVMFPLPLVLRWPIAIGVAVWSGASVVTSRLWRANKGHAAAAGMLMAISLAGLFFAPGAAYIPGVLLAAMLQNVWLLMFVGVLVWCDDNGPSHLGWHRSGWQRDALGSVLILAGTFATHLCAAMLIAIVVAVTDPSGFQEQLEERSQVLQDLLGDTPAWQFALLMLWVGLFEETVFRAFLLPRLKLLLRSWPLALVLGGALFGIGHLYEGPVAVFQTAVLGVYFGAAYVWRGRLLGVALAHAGFNIAMFVLLLATREGLFDALSDGAIP